WNGFSRGHWTVAVFHAINVDGVRSQNRSKVHARMADEVRTRRIVDPDPAAPRSGALGWGAELPGPQLPAQHARRGPVLLLPLQLPGAGRGRHRPHPSRGLSGPHRTGPAEPLSRPASERREEPV